LKTKTDDRRRNRKELKKKKLYCSFKRYHCPSTEAVLLTTSPIKGNETLKTVPSLHHPSKQQQQLVNQKQLNQSDFETKKVKRKVKRKDKLNFQKPENIEEFIKEEIIQNQKTPKSLIKHIQFRHLALNTKLLPFALIIKHSHFYKITLLKNLVRLIKYSEHNRLVVCI
jgi:hypothetical protein